MFETLKFIVVEDKEEDRAEVLNQLSDAGFVRANLLARPATFQAALEAINDHQRQLDVVFLDLNLPRDAVDSRPEKGHGRGLLTHIHRTLNPAANIRVVVVSGEDLLDGFNDKNMYELFAGTLVSIAQKADLAKTLTSSLKRLRKDPLAQRIRRAGLATVAAEYELVVDGAAPIGERLRAAQSVAIQLVRNETDHHLDSPDATERYADDLNGLIHDHIEPRFRPNERTGRVYIDIGAINAPGGWGAFLWRGALVQHLYVLNHYRNDVIHWKSQPYDDGRPSTWAIPRDTLERMKGGSALGVIAETIVRDLLEWYLPWHEQVYLPWLEKQP